MAVRPKESAVLSRISLALLFVITVLASLYLSSQKLFWQDELFEYYSDARPTLRAVVSGQLHWPFSLEPPAYHILLHLFQKLPLRPEFSTRIPSLVALLLLELSAFIVTLRLTRDRLPALLAAAIPLVLSTFQYSAEARVYNLLAGMYSCAFLSYSYVLSGPRTVRLVASLGLFCSLAACVLLHYFGILLAVPFLAAELIRFSKEAPKQWSALLAICASLTTFVLDLPFLRGLHDISAMYYDSGEARWDMAVLTYLWLFDRSLIDKVRRHGLLSHLAISIALLALAAGAVSLALLGLRQLRAKSSNAYFHTALGIGLFLPVLNLLVGIFKSNAYTPRYSLPAAFCVAVLGALYLRRFAHKTWVMPGAMLLVLVLGGLNIHRDIHQAREQTELFRSKLAETADLTRLPPEESPSLLYLQDTNKFLPFYFYAPPSLRARLMLLQSVAFEWKWNHSAASGHFARNMHYSTELPVTSWEQLSQSPGPFLLVSYGTGPDWLVREMAADKVPVDTVGHVLGGDLLRVRCSRSCPGTSSSTAGVPRAYIEKP